MSAFNRHCGVDVHEISAREVADMFPIARTDDVLAGFYVPGDGRVNPVDVTMSLAKGARMQGATIVQGVSVTDVLTRGRTCHRRRHRPRHDRVRVRRQLQPACGPASSARASRA